MFLYARFKTLLAKSHLMKMAGYVNKKVCKKYVSKKYVKRYVTTNFGNYILLKDSRGRLGGQQHLR